jgi:drug/metabolite transporter (DMT)-like permease
MNNKPKITAIFQALLVTFLWSTSWVLIKFGLEDIPALTFAGLRYVLAFIFLLPFFLRSGQAAQLKTLTRNDWLTLAGLGLVYYTITQSTQFLGLKYLPAITFSLMLNFSAPLVALLGIPLLKEKPRWVQWLGVGVFMLGALIYFYPVMVPAGMLQGFLIGLTSVVATSFASIIGRAVNRRGEFPALLVTVVTMGIGSIVLLGVGLAAEPLPQMGWMQWGVVVWLAAVNTAIAFTLWNHTLKTLSAVESSMINNTMLVQIALLAWLFLGERPSGQQMWGMAAALAGTVLVNLRNKGGGGMGE